MYDSGLMNEGQRGSWLGCLADSTNLAKNCYELLSARNTWSRDNPETISSYVGRGLETLSHEARSRA